MTKKRLYLLLIFIVTALAAMIFALLNGGVRLKVSDFPSSMSSGEVISISTMKGDIAEIRKGESRIKGSSLTEEDTDSDSIIIGKIDEEIRLIDFFIPGIHEEIDLGNKSTARSLVYINPLFSGLSLEDAHQLFNLIEQSSEFPQLVELVSNSNSLQEDVLTSKVADISVNIYQNFLTVQNLSQTNPNSNESLVTEEENPNLLQNIFKIGRDFALPPAFGQSHNLKYSYEIAGQLEHPYQKDENVSFWKRWQPSYWVPFNDLYLESDQSGFYVKGNPLIAYQVVSVKPKSGVDFYLMDGRGGSTQWIDSDKDSIVSGTLLSPLDASLIPPDGDVLNSGLSGLLQGKLSISKRLPLRDSKAWEHGEYNTYLVSGAVSKGFEKAFDNQKVSALDLNFVLGFTDLLKIFSFVDPNVSIIDVAEKGSDLFGYCLSEYEKSDSETFTGVFLRCMQSSKATYFLGSISGLKAETIEAGVMKIFGIQSPIWKKSISGFIKSAASVDRVFSVGRLGFLGAEIDRETDSSPYQARIKVVDHSRPDELSIDCTDSSPITHENAEISCAYGRFDGRFYLLVSNYSTNEWYEFERTVENSDTGKRALAIELVEPGKEDAQLIYDAPPGYIEWRRDRSKEPDSSGVQEFQFAVKMHKGSIPPKQLTIQCEDGPILVRGVAFTPKCTPNGIQVDVLADPPYPISISSPGIETLNLQPQVFGASWTGNYRSTTSRSMSFTVSVGR